MAQDEAPSIQQPALNNAGGISSSSKDAGGKKSRVGRSVEQTKHESVGVGFDNNNGYFKEITLHGNGSSVGIKHHSNTINETITNFTTTQDILISTTNHTILQIFEHEDRENSGNKLTIMCHGNHNINLEKIVATDDDSNNEDLIGQDILIDYISSSSSTEPTIIENDLMSNDGKNNQRLIARHSKRNSNDENLKEHEHMLQNDDPRLIAYNDPENVQFISLDDKSKSSEGTNGPTNIPVMISAVPLEQPGVPHYVVHDAKTRDNPKEIEAGPRILVNVSIATDHGSGTRTHAVYMLHVMVPAGIDINPSPHVEPKPEEKEFAPENLVLKPIEYVKYPSGRNPNDTPDISINEIDVGKKDYKGKGDPFSIRDEEQRIKTTPHSTLDVKKTEREEMPQENRKTTLSYFSDENETMVATGNDTQKNNTFDNHLEHVIDTNDDDDDDERQVLDEEEVTQTTDSIPSCTSTSSSDEDTIDDDKTMGGGCNCNHTIPYVLILEGEGKYFGILSTKALVI